MAFFLCLSKVRAEKGSFFLLLCILCMPKIMKNHHHGYKIPSLIPKNVYTFNVNKNEHP
jgi:hypothetical protein